MEEKIIIYVAGNPDLYPLEYYDADMETYRGVLPDLLQQFSENSIYDIRYYDTDGEDQRQQLAKNRQVDLISGCTDPSLFAAGSEQAVSVLNTVENGEAISYQILFSDVAPESFQTELTAFLAGITQETKNGMILTTMQFHPENRGLQIITVGLLLAVVLLSIAMGLLVRNHRRKWKNSRQEMETDAVTGLGNMDYLMRYYQQFIHDKNRVLYHLVYFYIDTERLQRLSSQEEVNEFLRYTAVVLSEYTADTDILARISADSFVLCRLSGTIPETEEWIMPVLSRIRAYAQKYGKPYETSASAGIYPLKETDRDLNALIFHAGQGAHAAYRNQEAYIVCTDQMLKNLSEERKLQADIDRALERQEIELYFQFYVDTKCYQIVGAEALSRWNHPEKGFLMPSRFIPLIEKEGTIYKLDYYCLDKVCAFLEELDRLQIKDFFVSCNFSRKTFAAVDFPQKCQEIIEKYSFSRELLIFEITESIAVREISQIRLNIMQMKEYGVQIVLDDFGEGFTSFYDLQQYPVDGLKLDKQLIDNIQTHTGRAILKAMIQVGHEIGLTILAEGVESDEQVQILQQIDCDVIQGYRFHLPIPAWEARKKITEQFSENISGS